MKRRSLHVIATLQHCREWSTVGLRAGWTLGKAALGPRAEVCTRCLEKHREAGVRSGASRTVRDVLTRGTGEAEEPSRELGRGQTVSEVVDSERHPVP